MEKSRFLQPKPNSPLNRDNLFKIAFVYLLALSLMGFSQGVSHFSSQITTQESGQ